MRACRPLSRLAAAALVASLAGRGAAASDVPLRNWVVPPPPALDGTFFTFGSAFVPITPCRVADTRDPVGPFGGPILPASTPRTFYPSYSPTCGVPQNAMAYSLNVTIVAPPGVPAGSFLTVWPDAFAQPLASTLNFAGGDVIANALIVRVGDLGGINVISNASVHVILDVNGVFTTQPPAGGTLPLVGARDGAFFLYALNTANGAGTRGLLGDAGGSGSVAGVEGRTTGEGPNPSSLSVGVLGRGKNAVVGATALGFGFGVRGLQYDSAGTTIVSEGILGSNFGPAYGVYAFTGTIGCNGCAKQFVDPHPTDPSKVIRYAVLEGGEAATYCRGSGKLTGGRAVVPLPEHFRYVTDEQGLTAHLTAIGGPAGLWVESLDVSTLVVRGRGDAEFSYLVYGVRPAFKDFQPIADGTNFLPRSAAEPMPAGWTEWTRRRLVENGTYHTDGRSNDR